LTADVTSASTPTRLSAAAQSGAIRPRDAETLCDVFVMLAAAEDGPPGRADVGGPYTGRRDHHVGVVAVETAACSVTGCVRSRRCGGESAISASLAYRLGQTMATREGDDRPAAAVAIRRTAPLVVLEILAKARAGRRHRDCRRTRGAQVDGCLSRLIAVLESRGYVRAGIRPRQVSAGLLDRSPGAGRAADISTWSSSARMCAKALPPRSARPPTWRSWTPTGSSTSPRRSAPAEITLAGHGSAQKLSRACDVERQRSCSPDWMPPTSGARLASVLESFTENTRCQDRRPAAGIGDRGASVDGRLSPRNWEVGLNAVAAPVHDCQRAK